MTKFRIHYVVEYDVTDEILAANYDTADYDEALAIDVENAAAHPGEFLSISEIVHVEGEVIK